MNKLQFLNILANAPKNLKNYSELLDYARNVYKQIMGVFPEGIDNISIKQAVDEVSKNRKKVIQFPPGGKDKTDFFSTRPDPRVKQPSSAKMDVQRANENIAGGSGYAEGDTKYNADVLADEIARIRGANREDLPVKESMKLYSEAYDYLTELNRLNKPSPGKGQLSVTIDGQTKNMTPEGIMEFLMKRGTKGTDITGDTFIGKAPKTKKTKPAIDPELQKSEDQKQMFLDFEGRNKTKPGSKIDYDKISEGLGGVKLRGDETFDELLEIEKNLNKPKKAKGGRIGFDKGGGTGVAGDQMEGDQYVISDIPGSPQVPMGQFGPLNVGIFGGGSYGKNEIIPGVDMATINQNYGIVGQFPIGNTGFSIGGDYMKSRVNERFTGNRIPGQVFKNVPVDSDRFNIGINFRKQFKDGSKPTNPGRRNFMKLMAGLASLPVIGKLFKGAKVAEKVVQLKNTTTIMPKWFPQFVERFLSKGVGKKVDQDLMEFKNPDLPGVTLTKHDDGRIFVEGKNAYDEPFEIDYTPPGYEVIDEATGKAVKTKGDFQAVDTQYRRTGPEMDDYDVDGVMVNDVDDILGGNATELEGFAKGTKKTKYTKGQKEVDMADAQGTRADFPEYEIDPTDYIDEVQDIEPFRKGGLAYMLGE